MLRSRHIALLISTVALVSAACGGGTDTQIAASGSSGPSTGTSGTGGSGASGGSTSASGSGASGGSGGASSSSSGSTGGGGGSPNVVRFVAMGDTGKGNQEQKDVATAIAGKCAQDGCDFVQLLGDNIYDSGVSSTSDPQWQEKFEVPYAGVDLPFWVVLGNHDYGGDGAGTDFGKGQHQINYATVSSKWKLPSAFYRRNQAHVEFFALDTNMAMFHQAGDQANQVKGWLAASQATWKIGFGHHPYLSNGPHGNAGEYEGLPFVPIINGAGVKDLLDDTVCGAADVYISGHDHSIQALVDKCGGSTELFVSGAGASSSELEGDNPTHYESLEVGFLYVKIVDSVLTAEVIDVAGSVVFSRTITK